MPNQPMDKKSVRLNVGAPPWGPVSNESNVREAVLQLYPFILGYFCLNQYAFYQADGDFAAVRIWNDYSETVFCHVSMLPSWERPLETALAQFLDELLPFQRYQLSQGFPRLWPQ